MTRKRKLFIAIISLPVLVIIGFFLYLNFADLGGWRDTVAELASDAIGRELRIDGEFQPEIGFTTRVVATDVTLANADWSTDPHMVSVERLAGEIDLLSILFGPITIGDVEISGARVLFETSTEGHFNWALGDGKPSEGGGGEFEMVIGHAALDAIHLVYRSGSGQDLVADLSKLEFTDDGTGMLDLGLAGSLDGDPIELSGRLGTFIGLINANRVEHDLTGRFADAEFSLRGSIDDLSSLSGVDSDLSAGGPDPSQITKPFGLDPVVEGPFSVAASVKPSAAGSDFNLDASLGGMTGKAVGTVDSIVNPGALDVSVDVSGPDTTAIGSIAGIDDLPAKPFAVSGRVQWSGFPLTCENFEVQVGDNTLSAHGVLGKPPLMMGTDFHFNGGGPDISAVAALAGLEVPKDSYAVDGHLVRLEHGVGVEKVSLEIGGITVEANGTVGDPPGYEGTALSLHGEGANLARIGHFVGFELPAQPFSINGDLAQGDGAIELEGVRARLGGTSLQVSGQLSTTQGSVGTDLRVKARGPDASQLAMLAGLETIPAEDFNVGGRIEVVAAGYRLRNVVGSLGTMNVKADGLIAGSPKMVGSDLQIHIDDSDLSHLASIAGIADLPPDPTSIDIRMRLEESGYHVSDLDATIGEVNVKVDGFVGQPPDLEGTDLRIDARGSRLAALGPYLQQPNLPGATFSVAGGLRVEEASLVLDQVIAEVAGNRAEVTGRVMPSRDLVGTDVSFDLRGSDLSEISAFVAGFTDSPDLPKEPYSLTGKIAVDDSGFDLREVELHVADSTARAAGRIGAPPGLLGSDLTIDIDGPSAILITALTGVTTPVAPFEAAGRIERYEAGFRFHGVTTRLGEYRAAVDGTLGELPKLIGTELEIHAAGPDTRLIEEIAGISYLPDRPFTLDGEFSGTSERFSTRGFELTFGQSDIEGSFTVDITGKPDVQARLTSAHLDLSHLRDRLEKAGVDIEEPADADPPTKRTTIFSNDPFDLTLLHQVDADVAVRVEQLVLKAKQFHDLKVDVHLEDGGLKVERITAVGQAQGWMDGSLALEPSEGGYRFRADLSAHQLRLDVEGAEIDRAAQPPIDIDIDLDAVGATFHEFASSADGAMQLVIGKGVMDSRVLDLVTADILLTLLNAFNPFAKQDAATELQCGVALLSLEEGVAKLEPMAFQSDKMTLLGHGKIDLRTEKLNLEWITKPRKGIGISASIITNPYIRLGGTLSAPSVQLKEAEAVVSTGAAVATMGLSLVAKGMYDRVTAEKKVCKRALEEIDARSHGKSGPSERKK